MDSAKVFAMKFSKVYPLLVQKAQRKGRSQAEVDEIIRWLTGYCQEEIQACLEKDVAYGAFFEQAPAWNPSAGLIKGVVCGVRVENVEDPLMWKVRCLDKLVDELAKGKAMEKILRRGEGAQ